MAENASAAPVEPDSEAHDARLRAEVASALARPGSLWSLPPLLRARYDASRAVERAREIRWLTVGGLVAYYIAIGFALVFVVERVALGIAAFELFAVPMIVVLITFGFYRADVPAKAREWAVLVNCCFVYVAMTAVFAAGPPNYFALDLMFTSCVVSGTMVVTRSPIRYAFAYLLLSVFGLTVAIIVRPAAPLLERLYPIGVLIATCTPTLLALWQLERATYVQYVRDVAKSLHMEELTSAVRALDDLSMTDPLTGVGNRRAFERRIAEIGPDADERHALLIVDVDHFKALNDLYGHRAGDECLRQVAQTIGGELRRRDSLARIGGDEFAVLLSDIGRDESVRIAERLCVSVGAHAFGDREAPIRVSLTIGGARWRSDLDADSLLARADAALYEAKRAGRACVRWASDVSTREVAAA